MSNGAPWDSALTPQSLSARVTSTLGSDKRVTGRGVDPPGIIGVGLEVIAQRGPKSLSAGAGIVGHPSVRGASFSVKLHTLFDAFE